MGLLNKVVSKEVLPPLTSERIDKAFNEGSGLLERSPLFFSCLMDFWNKKKGVLLTRNQGYYSPVEISGFDTTSGRKIRITSEELKRWGVNRDAEEISDKELFEDKFSFRELSLIRKIIIIPLFHDQSNPFALILLGIEDEDETYLNKDSIPFVNDKVIMEKLYRSLYPFPSDNGDQISTMDRNEIKKEIVTEGDQRVIMLIELAPLLEKIKKINPLRDLYELKKELLNLFSSFFNERVLFYLDDQDVLILSQPEDLFPGEKLMARQLMVSLNDLYGRKVTNDHLSLEVMKPSEIINNSGFFSGE